MTRSDIDLGPETVLELAAGIRTRRNAAGHILVDSPVGTVVDIGPRGFAILSIFSPPRTLGDAIAHLEKTSRGTVDFAPTMGAINILIEESVLAVSHPDQSPTSGWADPEEHARMLNDHRRTGDYIAALTAVVRPDDVVVDIGTGSGVLAVAAARAGARHVYAVEASDIADVARRVFEVNGVADRVTLIPGWSRQIELPQQADVLVSEIIGNEPLEEEILETTLDARRRLLAPGARLIPHGLTLMARPILLPAAEVKQRAFGRADVAHWQDLYAIDFEPLLDAAVPGPVYTRTEGEVVATWPACGAPAALASVDLAGFDALSLHGSVDLAVNPPGLVNAVAVTFRADLHDGITHTLDPWIWPASSWATSVWVLPDPVTVSSDSRLRVQYHRRVAGVADGLTCEVVG